MSADNWAICPFCVADARAEHDRKVREVNAAYGNVPVDEYRALDAALPDEFDPYSVEPSVREDWEIGLSDPEDTNALLIYSARCKTCGAEAKTETTVAFRRPTGSAA